MKSIDFHRLLYEKICPSTNYFPVFLIFPI